MAAVRAALHAGPVKVLAAVVGLSVVASLCVALVVGAGLSVWRGGAGRVPAGTPARPLAAPPRSGVVTVVGPTAPPAATGPASPARRPSSGTATGTGGTGAPLPQAAPPPLGPPPAPTPGVPSTPPPSVAPPPPTTTPASADVVALDSLLASLHGRGRHRAVAALEDLLDRPSATFSLDGTVQGTGPRALIAILRSHGERGVAARLSARLRREQSRAHPVPSRSAARGGGGPGDRGHNGRGGSGAQADPADPPGAHGGGHGHG